MRFTTNGMCAKNNPNRKYVSRTSNNRVIAAHDLLLLAATVWNFAHLPLGLCERIRTRQFNEILCSGNLSTRIKARLELAATSVTYVVATCFHASYGCHELPSQVTSLHKWKNQGINHKFLIGNRCHVTLRIVSPIICKQC